MNSKITKIYSLDCPITGEIKYIGKTIKSLNNRLSGHIVDSRRDRRKVSNWIKSLMGKGLKPNICLIEETENWEFEEQFYISYFRFLGFNLKNLSSGGEVGSIGVKWSVEQRKKLSESLKGRIVSEATRKKLSISKKGIKYGPMKEYHKKKISEANKGKKMAEIAKLRLSVSTKGRKMTGVGRSRIVIQSEKSGVLIRSWENIKIASKGLEISRTSIINNLKGRTNSAGGYKWTYKH